MMRSNTLRCLASLMLVVTPFAASAAVTQVAGEPSRTPAQAAPAWKLAQFPVRDITRQGYRELAIRRLAELENHNASQRIKATQIGVGRTLARPPQRLVQRIGPARSLHPPVLHLHAFRAQALALLAIRPRAFRECDASIRPQHAVPGQPGIFVLAEDACRQPGAAGQSGAVRHFAIAGHLPARDGADRGQDAVFGRLGAHAGLA